MSTATQPFTGTFVADPAHSSFMFTVRHMKVASFSARFDDVDARVVADEGSIRIEGAVRVESISIKNPPEFRQHVVYGDDFFDAGNHPEVTFRSDEVRLGDDGTATVRGELTIRGITKPFVAAGIYRAPVVDPYGSIRTAVELEATVDRRDWGMNWQDSLPAGGDALGYDVRLNLNVEFIKESE
ncbi:MAG: YceI family protein [Longimicrobiaceae bacterium]